MEAKPVRTVKVDGKDFNVFILDDGEFGVNDGGWIKSPSLKGLTDKLRAHVRVNRVKIKATLLDENKWHKGNEIFVMEDILITGIHGANQNVLYTDSEGLKHQSYRYSSSILRVMTAAEKKKLEAAYESKKEADKIYREMLEGLKLDVPAALVKAQEELMDKDAEEEKAKGKGEKAE